MYKVLPLFKSHYSLGHSILTLDEPKDKSGKPNTKSIFHLLTSNELSVCVLVDDNISGLLQASQEAEKNKIKLVFGLRIEVTEDMNQKDEASFKKGAKYIVFAKNPTGYDTLLKMWSAAAKEGFYYYPRIDFKTLRKLWNKNVALVVPFYDSFIFENSMCSHTHVPELDKLDPVFLIEDNDLPFDSLIQARVEAYCGTKYPMLPAQSIFYKSEKDFVAYLAARCLHNRDTSQKATLDKPELEHMGSHTFNFERWLAKEKATA